MAYVKYLVIVALCAAAAAYTYGIGFDAGENKVAAQWRESDKQAEKKRADTEAAYRDNERRLTAEIELNRAAYETKIAAVTDYHDAIVAGLRNRARRAEASAINPKADSSSKAPLACTGAALFAEDAKFLAGEAARADKLREQLAACRSDYDAAVAATSE